MSLFTFSIVSGVAFTFGKWYADELIKERKKREDLEVWKQHRLDEIRERRAEMGLST
jgi:hypothetical protein